MCSEVPSREVVRHLKGMFGCATGTGRQEPLISSLVQVVQGLRLKSSADSTQSRENDGTS